MFIEGMGEKKKNKQTKGFQGFHQLHLRFMLLHLFLNSNPSIHPRQHSALSLNSHSYHMTTTHVTLFDLEVQIHIEGIVASRAGGM